MNPLTAASRKLSLTFRKKMRIKSLRVPVLAIVFAVAAVGCSKQSSTETNSGDSASTVGPAHDKAYYAQHLDVAKTNIAACNKKAISGSGFSPDEKADCMAAEKAVHEANNPEYVPGNGKPFSSAGGTH